MTKFYTPPHGKCTNCNRYFGKPKTGKDEKDKTEPGEIFPSEYFCPVCETTTKWTRIHSSNFNEYLGQTDNPIITEDLENEANNSLTYEVWKPDYKK